MRALKSLLVVCLALLFVTACSDDEDTQPLTDGPVTTDDAGMADDTGTTDDDSGTGGEAALQVIANSLKLPTSAEEYAKDLDNDSSADNQLGAIVGALESVDAQAEMDSQINNGTFIFLFELFANSLSDATSAKVQFHLGTDLDSDASNNFSGSEAFGLDSDSPSNVVLNGAISGGKFSGGPGEFQIVIPLGSAARTLRLKNAFVEADVSATGIANGQVNGAIPMDDIENKLVPGIAENLDAVYKASSTSAADKAVLKSLFDTADDGTIEADDILNSAVLKLFIKADVDTDGDSTPDAMSAGLGFTATTCTITK